jgi:hypothetical protein
MPLIFILKMDEVFPLNPSNQHHFVFPGSVPRVGEVKLHSIRR